MSRELSPQLSQNLGAKVVNQDLLIEEFKHVTAEVQFIVVRYMQAGALYLAFVAFATKELLTSTEGSMLLVLFSCLSVFNCVALYVVSQFRSMAYHSLERQGVLADELRFQRPHHMVWGYYCGVISVLFSELAWFVIASLKT